ncbi:MAG: dihydroneopterin aldolase [Verrucomicrobiaceae bacterium]|jgi:dihydroneopterin aldolase|nr:dihydroneopterin aldolase [Verrucomicrobiaceae bacterium]
MSSFKGAETVADRILINGLELPVQIGVPDEERAGWQTLRADLELELVGRVEDFGDDLSATVDYDAVAREIRQLAAERPRRLIESLAGEIAQAVLMRPLVCGVTVTIRKRILPGVDDVAVRIHRAK